MPSCAMSEQWSFTYHFDYISHFYIIFIPFENEYSKIVKDPHTFCIPFPYSFFPAASIKSSVCFIHIAISSAI